jgi:hypothetical protein
MEPHNRHHVFAERGRKPCPPHGPHLVDTVWETSLVAQCLACGLLGPVRDYSLEAKLAFDEAGR